MKYLNNNFLNTANIHNVRNNDNIVNITYHQLNGINTLFNDVDVNTLNISFKEIFLPKANPYVLINYLSNLLYSKYMELSLLNTNSIRNISNINKGNFFTKLIKNYIQGNDYLINDCTSPNKVIETISGLLNLHYRNVIYNNNAKIFIIINPTILNYFYGFGFIKNDVHDGNIPKVGTIRNIDIYTNYEQNKKQIVCGILNDPKSVTIFDKDTIITDTIKWIGTISETSPDTKSLYDSFTFEVVSNLSWFKKLLYNLFLNK